MADLRFVSCPECRARLTLDVPPEDRRRARAVCSGCGWASRWCWLSTLQLARGRRNAWRHRFA